MKGLWAIVWILTLLAVLAATEILRLRSKTDALKVRHDILEEQVEDLEEQVELNRLLILHSVSSSPRTL